MYSKLIKALSIAAGLFALSATAIASNMSNVLVDANATAETRLLYLNLKNMSAARMFFGHQLTNMEGLTFSGPDGTKSDVKSAVGKFPAMYGWDIHGGTSSHIPQNVTLTKSYMLAAHARNGINTMHWRVPNPVTGGGHNDTGGNAVQAVLAGGAAYNNYIAELDDIADLANDVGIPILFRPLHENTHSGFWWGANHCTPSEYIALWQLTVQYLRDTRGVHNLLYVYSPHANQTHFLTDGRYPGDSYVDIVGASLYQLGDFKSRLLAVAKETVNFAEARGKIAAFAEVGPTQGFSDPAARDDFYTYILLDTIKNDATASKIAYAHVWRNGGSNHFWVPVAGDAAHSDFVSFFNDKVTLFETPVPDMYAPATTSPRGRPYCTASGTDPDGDGWGWDHNNSCIVQGGPQDHHTGHALTNSNGSWDYCSAAAVDPQGDGWGWENGASCIIPGAPADPQANW